MTKTGGRKAMPLSEKIARGERVKALRDRLGWTQEKVADDSGGRLPRPSVNKIEKGGNAVSTSNVQCGLAEAFSLGIDDIISYVHGDFDVDEAIRRRAKNMAPAPPPRERTTDYGRQSANLALLLGPGGKDYPWPPLDRFDERDRTTVIEQSETFASSRGEDMTLEWWKQYVKGLVSNILLINIERGVNVVRPPPVPTGGHPDPGPTSRDEFPPTKKKGKPRK